MTVQCWRKQGSVIQQAAKKEIEWSAENIHRQDQGTTDMFLQGREPTAPPP